VVKMCARHMGNEKIPSVLCMPSAKRT